MTDEPKARARGISRAKRANSDASGYGRSVEAPGTVPVQRVVNAGMGRRIRGRISKRCAGFERDGGNAEESAASAVVILAAGIRMMGSNANIVVRRRRAMIMDRPVGMRVRCGFRFDVVNMRGDVVIA